MEQPCVHSSTAPIQLGSFPGDVPCGGRVRGCHPPATTAMPAGRCSGSLATVPNLGQVGATFPKPPCSPFWLGLPGMGIFVTWGIVTYQQYFSGFFQFPFPEIPRFKRKEASTNTALGAAVPIPEGV